MRRKTDADQIKIDGDRNLVIAEVNAVHIYNCTTGRAIRGNIQFEAGSIGPSTARDNTEAQLTTSHTINVVTVTESKGDVTSSCCVSWES